MAKPLAGRLVFWKKIVVGGGEVAAAAAAAADAAAAAVGQLVMHCHELW